MCEYMYLIMCMRREIMKSELQQYWSIGEEEMEFYVSLMTCNACARDLTGFWKTRIVVLFSECWMYLRLCN